MTWQSYQDIIDAYQHREPAEGRKLMTKVIDTLAAGVPAALTELRTLGRTLHRRRDDVLAYFDHPGTSNGPSEAICESRFGWSGTGWSGWMLVVPARV